MSAKWWREESGREEEMWGEGETRTLGRKTSQTQQDTGQMRWTWFGVLGVSWEPIDGVCSWYGIDLLPSAIYLSFELQWALWCWLILYIVPRLWICN